MQYIFKKGAVAILSSFILLCWIMFVFSNPNEEFNPPLESYLLSKDEDKMKPAKDDTQPRIRLLCFVLTNPKYHDTKSVAVKETWGKRCDKLIFMSSVEDKKLGSINLGVHEGKSHLWGKTKKAFKYCYDHHLNDYDWFYKGDDDTFLIVENLRYILMLYDPDFPIALGERVHRNGIKEYLSGGAGYVISRAALKKFVEVAIPNPNICRPNGDTQSEDVQMGRCMTNSGIMLGDTRDEFGIKRFFQHTPKEYIDGKHISLYPSINKYKFGKGIQSLSETTIAFHKLKETSQLYALEFFIYKLQVFGSNREFTALVPPHLPPDIDAIPEQVLTRFGHPNLNKKNLIQGNVSKVDGVH